MKLKLVENNSMALVFTNIYMTEYIGYTFHILSKSYIFNNYVIGNEKYLGDNWFHIWS